MNTTQQSQINVPQPAQSLPTSDSSSNMSSSSSSTTTPNTSSSNTSSTSNTAPSSPASPPPKSQPLTSRITSLVKHNIFCFCFNMCFLFLGNKMQI